MSAAAAVAGSLPDRIALEAYVLTSRNAPDRAQPQLTRLGFATFIRASAERNHWRGHAIIFRGDDFLTREGDPNYLSVRRDGTPFRLARGVFRRHGDRPFVRDHRKQH